MTLAELLVTFSIGITLLSVSARSIIHLKEMLQRQQALVFLHSEAWQAIHAMEQAIRSAHNPKKELDLLALKIDHSCQLESGKTGQFALRKGKSSMNGSDCFYTYNDRVPTHKKYQGFFLQAPTSPSSKQGFLHRQSHTRVNKLHNQALIGHIQEIQIKAGIIHRQAHLKWLDPHELNEQSAKPRSTRHDIAALKIQMWLQKEHHTLFVEKIIARRNRESIKK